ncbi:MAG: response regulator [Candidatus Dormibacteraeota bacterium]|nr:response regulator [Candidatus Dormibacteraeota bacterium]
MANLDQSIHVLLIEDDPAVLPMYRRRLERDGYTVQTAADGEEGLASAARLSPDIVFLDLRLPRMDGFEVLRRLRGQAETAAIPVVILSNYPEEENMAIARNLGALEFLVKARITPGDLSEGIDEWLKE